MKRFTLVFLTLACLLWLVPTDLQAQWGKRQPRWVANSSLQDSLDARASYFTSVQVCTCVTEDGSVTAWTSAAAPHRMFTVTGAIYVHGVFGIVDETLTESGAGADISLGVAGATAGLIAVTDPTGGTLAAGDVWTNAATGSLVPLGTPSDPVVLMNIDIDLKVAANTIDDGIITIYVLWSPVPPTAAAGSVMGSIARAVWD